MRIMYLTQWFDPEPGVIKGPAFVRAIEAAGHDVTVVTGFPNYPTGKIYPGYKQRILQKELIDGVRVERLPLHPSHDSSSAGRALNFISFFVSALTYGVLRAGRYDMAYVYHPPITVGLAAAVFGWLRRISFILEIQDLWPDSVAASGMAGTGRMARVLNVLCNFVYRRAARIVAQSHGMKRLLVERGVPADKVVVIRNWADETALSPAVDVDRTDVGFRTRFTIVYGGNLGRAQALASVIRAAKRADELGGAVDLVLVGDGVDKQDLERLAVDLGTTNVRFLPRISKQGVARLFAAADVLLMHLADHSLFEATIPSKTQFYLAAGKPILAGVKGEAAEILTASEAAIVVPPEDVEAMAAAMVALSHRTPKDLRGMGTRGRNFYDRELSFGTAMATTLETVAAIGHDVASARGTRVNDGGIPLGGTK